jgi:endonuclease YncB( thermonuclease family)
MRGTASRWHRHILKAAVLPGFVAITVVTSTVSTAVLARSDDGLAAQFTICGSQRRVNCVVDGDTFWFQRQKIRIADIDAPELSPPRCFYEREKGEAAKRRLLTLLNAGPFSMSSSDRDEDRYGRKLRIVERKGISIGSILVKEELARNWTGNRRPWCERMEKTS